MFPSQLLLVSSALLAALTNATPKPRVEIAITIEEPGDVKHLSPSFAPQTRLDDDFYDCSDKPDGNYYHPADCTRFVSCSGGIASERDCANCNVDPERCPLGRTVYDEESE